LAERRKAMRLAFLCTIASVAGALAGYALGHFLWESVGEAIIRLYGYEAAFARFSDGFREYGVWLVLFFGVSFFPFKVITIASGVVAMDPLAFTLTALIARALRFLPEAWLLWRFGPPIRAFIERRLVWIVSLFTILLVGGILMVAHGGG
ncbi:MAG: DedA family protein, partial [Alphaproteobacteria bacterium]